jgi:hypothetical protein
MTTALQKPACPASPVFLDVHAFSAVLRVSLRGNDIGAVRPPTAQGKLMTVGRNRRFGLDRNGALEPPSIVCKIKGTVAFSTRIRGLRRSWKCSRSS